MQVTEWQVHLANRAFGRNSFCPLSKQTACLVCEEAPAWRCDAVLKLCGSRERAEDFAVGVDLWVWSRGFISELA